MYIGQGWARLGFNRSGSADYYLKGAMRTTPDPASTSNANFAGVAVRILGGATALTVVASSLVAFSLTF